ncbi:hypothetical protein R6Z07F_001668 [Ovis aries]
MPPAGGGDAQVRPSAFQLVAVAPRKPPIRPPGPGTRDCSATAGVSAAAAAASQRGVGRGSRRRAPAPVRKALASGPPRPGDKRETASVRRTGSELPDRSPPARLREPPPPRLPSAAAPPPSPRAVPAVLRDPASLRGARRCWWLGL